MEQKIGYKVLTEGRFSLIQKEYEGGLDYPKSKEIKPNKDCGPLCVFISHKSALIFARGCLKNTTIVKCKYKESTIESVWSDFHTNRHASNLPNGTVLADSVTCLE